MQQSFKKTGEVNLQNESSCDLNWVATRMQTLKPNPYIQVYMIAQPDSEGIHMFCNFTVLTLMMISSLIFEKDIMDLFRNTTTFLTTMVSNSYPGMPRGQISMCLPQGIPQYSFKAGYQ